MISALKTRLSSSKTMDMTQGNIKKHIVSFAVPVMIGNIFQQLYNMVDTAVVGRYVGTDALAAVGSTGPVVQLLIGLIIGLGGGLAVVISQKFGSGDKTETKKAITNGLYLTLAISVVITILGFIICRPLFELINTPTNIIDDAVKYSQILFLGTVATAIYNYEAAVLRSLGNSAVPLLFLILSSVLNVILDILFVVSFGFGIIGVAVATVIAQLVSCILCYAYIKKSSDTFSFTKEHWKADGKIIKLQLKLSLPMAFFGSLLSVSFLLVQSALNSLGSAEIAAYTAAYKLDTLMMQILSAFGTSISTFSAQNYGKNQFDRIHKGARSCLKITTCLSVITALLVFCFGKYFMILFVGAKEVHIIQLGVQYMQVTSCFYIILGVNFVIRFVLTSVGKTSIPIIVGVLEIAVRAISTMFLIYPLGFTGMTLTNPLCWGTSTLLVAILYPSMMRNAEKKKLNAGAI